VLRSVVLLPQACGLRLDVTAATEEKLQQAMAMYESARQDHRLEVERSAQRLKQALAEKDTEINRILEREDDLKEQVALALQLNVSLESKVEKLERDFAEASGGDHAVALKIGSLEGQLQKAQDTERDLRTQLAAKSDDIGALQEELTDLRRQYEALRTAAPVPVCVRESINHGARKAVWVFRVSTGAAVCDMAKGCKLSTPLFGADGLGRLRIELFPQGRDSAPSDRVTFALHVPDKRRLDWVAFCGSDPNEAEGTRVMWDERKDQFDTDKWWCSPEGLVIQSMCSTDDLRAVVDDQDALTFGVVLNYWDFLGEP